MTLTGWVILFIIIAGLLFSVLTGRLTLPAGLTGALLGWVIFKGAGATGFAVMTTFFLLGTLATSWKLKRKQALGLAENNKGKRKASQVMANAGFAALAGAVAWLQPQYSATAALVIAAAFASATADTLSSELGNVYGKKFYNIITWQKDNRGLDGVISAEGTLLGIAGSIIIALVYAAGYGISGKLFIIVFAGTVGNLFDSLLGATLERRRCLGNDAVNFLNTAVAGLLAWALDNL
ncbi:DUF92 domain-containing protein [Foetidibacter luteolus]|uniref:DUF92 domain-containing protein n=1 Tax=Foetidibacter luteolus TaxID=2608880 RepID=UPI00129A6977|nr:DUF92 domain-containing protein [Foetidibacter luteolus]